MDLKTKGQVNNAIVSTMILLMIIGFLGIINVTIFSSIETSVSGSLSSSTSSAQAALNNMSGGFYDGYDLAANIPIILAAGLLLAVIVGFAVYVRG